MIRKEYETGGFPITRRTPIVCLFLDGHVKICYNRLTLKKTIEKQGGPVRCLGVWPGKKSTDCFLINPEYYIKFSDIPEIYADIDSAVDISIIKEGGIFSSVVFIPYDSEDRVTVVCKDRKLYDYIISVGLKNKKINL